MGFTCDGCHKHFQGSPTILPTGWRDVEYYEQYDPKKEVHYQGKFGDGKMQMHLPAEFFYGQERTGEGTYCANCGEHLRPYLEPEQVKKVSPQRLEDDEEEYNSYREF